jgi:hypothetical protein
LGKDLHLGQLTSTKTACYSGTFTISNATDSRLTSRFAPQGALPCSQWTVVFTHLSGGDLRMAVDPDGTAAAEPEFEVRMSRQG